MFLFTIFGQLCYHKRAVAILVFVAFFGFDWELPDLIVLAANGILGVLDQESLVMDSRVRVVSRGYFPQTLPDERMLADRMGCSVDEIQQG